MLQSKMYDSRAQSYALLSLPQFTIGTLLSDAKRNFCISLGEKSRFHILLDALNLRAICAQRFVYPLRLTVLITDRLIKNRLCNVLHSKSESVVPHKQL